MTVQINLNTIGAHYIVHNFDGRFWQIAIQKHFGRQIIEWLATLHTKPAGSNIVGGQNCSRL